VFDIGEDNGTLYMVTEFIDGATLRQQRPESLRRQLDIAAQIAEALAAAHRNGITHRDLKPENIMITARDGRAKILDFGLARYIASANEATRSAGPQTEPGVIMGTAGYMSPEQARGKMLDHRSDIFSLGAVFHELFGGGRAFEGDTFADTVTSILSKDPPELPANVPPGVRQIVERCLEKDPERRFQSAQDLAFALRALSGSSTTVLEKVEAVVTSESSAGRKARRWPAIVAAAVALVFALAFWRLASEPGQPDLSSYRFRPFAIEDYAEGGPVWSPDGRSIAYVRRPAANSELVVKSTDGSIPTVITRGSVAFSNVSWTPDGSRLYYTAGSTGRVFSVSRAGGEPALVADGTAFAAALSPDGKTLAALMREDIDGQTQRVLRLKSPPESEGKRVEAFPGSVVTNRLVWSPDGSKILLSVQGRPPELRLFDVRAETSRRIAEIPIGLAVSPAWLTDNRHILIAWPEEETESSNLWVLDTETGARTLMLAQAEANAAPAVSPSGTVAYTTSLSQLDIVEFPVDGSPPRSLLATRQDESSASWSPVAPEFAYVSENQIRLRHRDGTDRVMVTGEHFPPRTDFLTPSFSPDGSRVAYVTWVNRQPPFKAWISPVTGGAPTPLGNFSGSIYGLSWSPDGRWIAFNSENGLSKIAVGSSGEPQVLLLRESCGAAPSWSPDSSKILCRRRDGLAVLDPNGVESQKLGPVYELAGWSKDMRYIYAIRNSEGKRQLGRVDLSNTQFQPLADVPVDWLPGNRINQTIRLSLSHDGKSLALPVS
jgi:Tol biopolymer transport system component